jgi:hypothetical protein
MRACAYRVVKSLWKAAKEGQTMVRTLVLTIAVGVLVVAASPAANAAVDPATRCKDLKAKATGKKAAALLKAFMSNVKKPNVTKLQVDVSRAQSRFTKAFTKAESRGDCQAPGDAPAIEGKTDAYVWAVITDAPLCPSSTSTTTTTPSSSTTTTTTCDCCGFTQLSFETRIGSGTCGTVANYRCSGGDPDFMFHACDIHNGDADCDLGPCTAGVQCQGDTSITCTVDADCQGTCGQVSSDTLDCGAVYIGGGQNSVPLPLPVPDQGLSITNITGCDSGTGVLTLGPTTPAEVGERHCTEGRKCSSSNTPCVVNGDCPSAETCETRCLLGPPMPIPDSANTPTSLCAINVVVTAASGTAQCDGGATDLSLPMATLMHLTGDLLSDTWGPVDVPGIQPCPLCSPQCVGGANGNQPCEGDSDCPGSTCDGTPNCIGGINHGSTCTPGSSKLSAAFPTSHDCQVNPSLNITPIRAPRSFTFDLTTSTVELQGVDQPTCARTFCGYCRDVLDEGSYCFDGDPDDGRTPQSCPESVAQPTCQPASGSTAGCGNAIPCTDAGCRTGIPCIDDSDCTAPYESCAQRSPGAFSSGASTVITVSGSTDGGCLGDGAIHTATLVSAFCISPHFDSTVDGGGDLPGPGAAMLQVEAVLSP